MAIVAVLGDTSSHTGALVATGAKLTVSGIIIGVAGDIHIPHVPVHASTVVPAPQHKLTVSGITVAALGDVLSCSATLIGTGAKLTVI